MAVVIQLNLDGFDKQVTVRKLAGNEEMSSCYHYDVVVEIEASSVASFDPLGKRATLKFMNDSTEIRSVPAKVAESVQLNDPTLAAEKARFRLQIVPDLWFMGLAQKTQVYIDTPLSEIVANELGASGIQHKILLGSDVIYKERPLTCQYKESDLNFISRLLEDRGVYYYFAAGKSADEMVISDATMNYGNAVTLHETEIEPGTWTVIARMAPNRVLLSGYDFRNPSYQVFGEAKGQDVGYDIHVNDEPVLNQDEATKLAQVRLEQLQALSHHVTFRSFNCGLRAGYQFDRAGKYVVTHITHTYVHEDTVKAGEPNHYRNSVTAIESNILFRPAKTTHVPRASGNEIAHIHSATSSEKAMVDGEGLYNVALNYVSDKQHAPIGRLRMQQPAAGQDDGFYFPLKHGVEVVIAFTKGNPDLPYIHGSMAHGQFPSHVTSFNAHHSIIKARHLLLFKSLGGMHTTVVADNYPVSGDHEFVRLDATGAPAGSSTPMDRPEEELGQVNVERRYGDKYWYIDGCDFRWTKPGVSARFNYGNDYVENHEITPWTENTFEMDSKVAPIIPGWTERENGLVEKTWGDKMNYRFGRNMNWAGGNGPAQSLETYNYGPRYVENLIDDEQGSSKEKGGMHADGMSRIGASALVEKTYGDTYDYHNGNSATIIEGNIDHEQHGNVKEVLEGDTDFQRTGKLKVVQDGDVESEYMTNIKTTTHGDIEETTDGKVTATIQGKIEQTYNGGRETTELAATNHTYKAALTVKQFSLDEKTDTNKTEVVQGTHKTECAISQEKVKAQKTLEAPVLQLKGNLATVKHSLIMLG